MWNAPISSTYEQNKKSIIDREVDSRCWSDSQVVLSWLNDHPSKWVTFVATRVSDILTTLPESSWNFVSTKENPADLVTRGLPPEALSSSSLWWSGPEWLFQREPHKPTRMPLKPEDTLERRQKATFSLVVQTPREDSIERFSSYNCLLRVIAYYIRFANIRRDRNRAAARSWLTSRELTQSRNAVIKLVQGDYFSSEVNALQAAQDIPRKSTLRSLCPFLDVDGLLRVGGRLTNAMLIEKHPIILAKSISLLTRLIILHGYHQT